MPEAQVKPRTIPRPRRPLFAATTGTSPGHPSGLTVAPDPLRLTIDNVSEHPAPRRGVRLTLRAPYGATEPIEATVSSTRRCTVGLREDLSDQARAVVVTVREAEPAEVWVAPCEAGPPNEPGAHIDVGTDQGTTRAEVWIEPIGGQWLPAGFHNRKLDLVPRPPVPATHPETLPLDITSPTVNDVVMPSAMPPNLNLFPGVHLHGPAKRPQWKMLKPEGRTSVRRWYPSVTTLPDGRMLITSGSRNVFLGRPGIGNDPGAGYWDLINNDYEIYDPEKNVRGGRAMGRPYPDLIDDAALRKKLPRARLATYPAVFVLPKGDRETVLALVEMNRTWLYEYLPDRKPPLKRAPGWRTMAGRGSRSYPTAGSAVLLPFTDGDAAMRLFVVGGQHESRTEHRATERFGDGTATAEILRIDTAESLTKVGNWHYTKRPLRRPRLLCDATLLADGNVLISGGAEQGRCSRGNKGVYEAELFDTESEEFQPVASGTTDRRFHSTALLQPDGTVLKAGSTGGFEAERYFPAYLWRGPRPTVFSDGRLALTYDGEFTVTAKGANLSRPRLAIVRLGSPAHGSDTGQRFIWLQVTGYDERTGRVRAKAPKNPAAAPPGDYYFIVADDLKVPSEARIVRVGPGPK
ncbi:DUF1929 domain-containing protein [Streptomyces piniterrae]|uniref:DUF1929 domain-containing protein n=1 Tax=Streptomyces piniterrae TaxID=2571125 RepID=A0A4U0NJY7_9ACTN|nr:galactose oxidase-like domain-containing protein [Streptomyces piniterrae]TJZ54520.1 DUF1929 domain-containing protein [Streptomyces piniterrae]